MAQGKANVDLLTLVNTPSGFLTTETGTPAKTETEEDFDRVVENLLKKVDVPLFRREPAA